MPDDQRDQRYPDGPYGFVPLAEGTELAAIRVGRGAPGEARTGHERATGLSGTLLGELSAMTPVRVGTGALEMGDTAEAPLYQPMFRVNGVPAIPGSSLKGAVRAVVEAITRSCVLQTRAPLREPRGCEVIGKGSNPERTRLCPACRIFGAQGFMGRATFADACLAEGQTVQMVRLPQLWRPRSEMRHIYFTESGNPKGRKLYRHGYPDSGTSPTEVCPARSRFSLRLDFRDLTEPELGALLWAVGCTPPDDSPPVKLKLGGSKPSCCGSVAFALDRLVVHHDVDRWERAFETADGGDPGSDAAPYMNAAQATGLVVSEQLKEVRRLLSSVSRGDLRKCGYEPMDEKEGKQTRW